MISLLVYIEFENIIGAPHTGLVWPSYGLKFEWNLNCSLKNAASKREGFFLIFSKLVIVVYFDQNLGAAHAKRHKNRKKKFSTSFWIAHYPKAGRNIQHMIQICLLS